MDGDFSPLSKCMDSNMEPAKQSQILARKDPFLVAIVAAKWASLMTLMVHADSVVGISTMAFLSTMWVLRRIHTKNSDSIILLKGNER